MTIIERASEGLPWGSYDVSYYYQDGRRQQRCDTDMSSREVEQAARALGPREVMVAVCRSQPGGMTAWGSAGARSAWESSAESGDSAEMEDDS